MLLLTLSPTPSVCVFFGGTIRSQLALPCRFREVMLSHANNRAADGLKSSSRHFTRARVSVTCCHEYFRLRIGVNATCFACSVLCFWVCVHSVRVVCARTMEEEREDTGAMLKKGLQELRELWSDPSRWSTVTIPFITITSQTYQVRKCIPVDLSAHARTHTHTHMSDGCQSGSYNPDPAVRRDCC